MRFRSHCVQTLLPDKMLRSIVLMSLLISSACALHLEMHQIKLIGEELEEDSADIQAEQLPGVCWACKWAMGKLKKHISNATNKEDVKKQLLMVCDGIGFLKALCKMFVNNYIGTLIEELSTTDDAKTICINVGVC